MDSAHHVIIRIVNPRHLSYHRFLRFMAPYELTSFLEFYGTL